MISDLREQTFIRRQLEVYPMTWGDLRTMAQDAGLSGHKVKRTLNALIVHGAVEVFRNGAGARAFRLLPPRTYPIAVRLVTEPVTGSLPLDASTGGKSPRRPFAQEAG